MITRSQVRILSPLQIFLIDWFSVFGPSSEGLFYSLKIIRFVATRVISRNMAWTQENLEALESAIAQGANSVTYGNKTVHYRSLSEMMQLRNLMRQELGLSNPARQRVLGSYSNGLHPKTQNE
jgi:hypothetical protein